MGGRGACQKESRPLSEKRIRSRSRRCGNAAFVDTSGPADAAFSCTEFSSGASCSASCGAGASSAIYLKGMSALGRMFADFIDETSVGLIGVEPAGHGIESGEHGAPLKHAEVISSADSRKTFDLIMSKIGVNESITSVRWSLAGS